MSILRPILYGLGAVGVFALIRRFWGGHVPLDCSTEFTAAQHGPKRDTSNIRLIVLHVTDPPASVKIPTARSTAAYFAGAPAGTYASTHMVVDDTSCYRTLPDDIVPYGATGGDANKNGLHIEMAGHSYWSRAEWLGHDGLLQRAGSVLAAWADQYGIPLVLLSPEATASPLVKGVTTHANVTQGWHVAGGHMDPGVNFPFDVLLRYARGG